MANRDLDSILSISDDIAWHNAIIKPIDEQIAKYEAHISELSTYNDILSTFVYITLIVWLAFFGYKFYTWYKIQSVYLNVSIKLPKTIKKIYLLNVIITISAISIIIYSKRINDKKIENIRKLDEYQYVLRKNLYDSHIKMTILNSTSR